MSIRSRFGSRTVQSQAGQSVTHGDRWADYVNPLPIHRSQAAQAAQAEQNVRASRMSRFGNSIKSAFSKLRRYLTRTRAPQSQVNNLNRAEEFITVHAVDPEELARQSRIESEAREVQSVAQAISNNLNQPWTSRRTRSNSVAGTGLNIPSAVSNQNSHSQEEFLWGNKPVPIFKTLSVIPEEHYVQSSISREESRLKKSIDKHEQKMIDYHVKAFSAYQKGNIESVQNFLKLKIKSKKALEGSINRLSNLKILRSRMSRR